MVAKRDDKSDSSSSTEVELAAAQEIIERTGSDLDRWHVDNIDQMLFETEAASKLYFDDDLRDIVNFDEYLNSLPREAIIKAGDWLGSGATFLRKDDKKLLVGVPFAVIQWQFVRSTDFEGGWFVYAEVIDQHNRRFALTDGAKFGLRDDLAQITVRNGGKQNHLMVEKGLKSRTYVTKIDGKDTTVTVYSIAR